MKLQAKWLKLSAAGTLKVSGLSPTAASFHGATHLLHQRYKAYIQQWEIHNYL